VDAIDALGMQASWISATDDARPGAWLLRRDVDLGTALTDRDSGADLELLSASMVAASTGDVEVYVDGHRVGAVRFLGPASAGTVVADVTDRVLGSGRRTENLALGLRHVEDRPVGAGRAPGSVLAGLVLTARPVGARAGSERTIVVGTDTSWLATPAGITFEARADPARRLREVHEGADAETAADDADPLGWTRFGVMHTDARRRWRPAVDRGRHPSLVHPPLVQAPELVEEEVVPVLGRVLAPGGVQCLDLGQTARCRPVLALPEGARRPITVWSGPVPGTPPRGGDISLETFGRAAVLDAHGTTSGRWLHVHGAPDLEIEGIALPVRAGILPRPFGIDLSDERVAQFLGDGIASLRARSQERYLGEDGVPVLAEIVRTARCALWLGGDTWRSARALEAYLGTAHETDDGTVVDVIAPDGPRADLDEHTYALPGWVADHAALAPAPRRAGAVIGGIAARLLRRIEHGPSPAARMSTLAAALDALDAFTRLARRAGAPDQELRRYVRAAEDLRRSGRVALRATRQTGGSATYLAARGDAASTPTATALAVLSGLVEASELAVTCAALRPVLDDVQALDATGSVRGALLRSGSGRQVLDAHRDGDDVPPLVLSELVSAVSGLTIDGDRLHVRTPALPLVGLDLDVPHARGTVRIRWDGAAGTIDAPPGTHVLVHPDGASSPVWYNSGSTAVQRPDPTR